MFLQQLKLRYCKGAYEHNLPSCRSVIFLQTNIFFFHCVIDFLGGSWIPDNSIIFPTWSLAKHAFLKLVRGMIT